MTSYLTKIRGIPVKGLNIHRIIDSNQGIVEEPGQKVDLLVLTETTILLFRSTPANKAHIIDKNSIQHISVQENKKNTPILTMLSFLMCSVIVYVGLGYGISSQINQPIIPLANMGVIPFFLLIVMVSGLIWMWKIYSFKDGIELIINCDQSLSWKFTASLKVKQVLLESIVYFKTRVDI
tara:strand:- start:7421 stop:7960 length:540 start_codon:yes stop_codon:yes gene_type:complete